MAGILDDVMDGIAAKEKQGGQTPPATTTAPAQQTATLPEQQQQYAPPAGDKSMHGYSEQFKKQYGERK